MNPFAKVIDKLLDAAHTLAADDPATARWYIELARELNTAGATVDVTRTAEYVRAVYPDSKAARDLRIVVNKRNK